jgi:protein-disulfide isomerase
LFFIGQGVYNYAVYGNCNGKNSTQFCIFDPLGTNTPSNVSGEVCAVPGMHNATLTRPEINLEHEVYRGDVNASVTIIEFGCYSCHYTGLAEPTVKKIIDKYDGKILYVYIDFPLSLTHENALLAAEAAHCALDQGKYWEYRDYLFANQPKQYYDDLIKYAEELDLNAKDFKKCLDDKKYADIVNENYNVGIESGISVTPTFFINDQTIVGAKDYKEFKNIINKELGIPWWQFWR